MEKNKQINQRLISIIITIHIKDNGVGMTWEQIENIMSDEFIISSTNIDIRKGNGLGYLIINDLLKMLEGNLSIQSKKWEGTIVSVNFPVRKFK